MQEEAHFPTEPPPYGYSSHDIPYGYAHPTTPPPGYSSHESQDEYVLQAYPQRTYNQQTCQSRAPPQYYGPASPQCYGSALSQGYVTQNFGAASQQLGSSCNVRERPIGCCNRYRINKPQSNVLLAATLIFITGGMNLAWSVGFRSNFYSSLGLSTHEKVAWFIGAIIGAAFSSFVPQKVPQKALTLLSAALVLVAGTVSASSSFYITALTAARYLNGIATGLVFAPTLVLAGEIAACYTRGKLCAGTEQLGICVGIFVQIMLSSTWGAAYGFDDFNPERLSGVVTSILGSAAICLAVFLFIESPVALLIGGHEQEATIALRRLQCQNAEENDAQAQLMEHKLYVAESRELALSQSLLQACPAFGKLLILRVLNALSISSFIHYALTISTDFNSDNLFHSTYILFGTCRLLGSLIATLSMDSVGRKLPTLLGLLGCSGLVLGTASQFNYLLYFSGVQIMLILFQLFAGIAFSASSAYLSEAFPLVVKRCFISLIFVLELLILILFATCAARDEFLYALGALYFGAFLLYIWALPETKRTTLREARRRFKFC